MEQQWMNKGALWMLAHFFSTMVWLKMTSWFFLHARSYQSPRWQTANNLSTALLSSHHIERWQLGFQFSHSKSTKQNQHPPETSKKSQLLVACQPASQSPTFSKTNNTVNNNQEQQYQHNTNNKKRETTREITHDSHNTTSAPLGRSSASARSSANKIRPTIEHICTLHSAQCTLGGRSEHIHPCK